MPRSSDRADRVRRYYDAIAGEYHESRYGTPEKQRLDARAKAIVLDLLDGQSVKGMEVLDCGCGTGRFSELFSGLGADVLGIDTSPRMLDVARARVPRARFELGDLFRLDSLGRFDLVVCSQVLTHLHDYDGPLRSMRAVLREDGILIVDVRNLLAIRNAMSFAKATLLNLFGRELDYDPGYTTVWRFRASCTRAGFRSIRWTGFSASTDPDEPRGRLSDLFAPTLVFKLQTAASPDGDHQEHSL